LLPEPLVVPAPEPVPELLPVPAPEELPVPELFPPEVAPVPWLVYGLEGLYGTGTPYTVPLLYGLLRENGQLLENAMKWEEAYPSGRTVGVGAIVTVQEFGQATGTQTLVAVAVYVFP
jgi:hypothetical protein